VYAEWYRTSQGNDPSGLEPTEMVASAIADHVYRQLFRPFHSSPYRCDIAVVGRDEFMSGHLQGRFFTGTRPETLLHYITDTEKAKRIITGGL
jgi:hypothetical protein